jgi:hypothetical protein
MEKPVAGAGRVDWWLFYPPQPSSRGTLDSIQKDVAEHPENKPRTDYRGIIWIVKTKPWVTPNLVM